MALLDFLRGRRSSSEKQLSEGQNKQLASPDKQCGNEVGAFVAGTAMYNRDYLADFYPQMEFDETISVALDFLTFNVVSKLGTYEHEDPKIKDLGDRSEASVKGTMKRSVRQALCNALGYGYSVSEFTLFAEKGQWLLSSLVPYAPLSCTFVVDRMPDNSVDVSKIRQRPLGGVEVDIPRAKCLILRHGAGTYGQGRFRLCFRWWDLKGKVLQFWPKMLERYGMPTVVGKSDQTDDMAAALANIHSNSWIAVGTEDEVAYLDSTKDGSAYEKALNFANKMLYRSLFLPSLMESGEQGGSFSLGKTHYEMFDDACMWLAQEIAAEIVEQVWRPLIEWNFGPQDSYGTIPVREAMTAEEKKIMAEVFEKMVNSGAVYPEDGDNVWMRERLEMPEPPDRIALPPSGE